MPSTSKRRGYPRDTRPNHDFVSRSLSGIPTARAHIHWGEFGARRHYPPRCKLCVRGYARLRDKVCGGRPRQTLQRIGCTRAAFRKMCKVEGIAVTMVMGERKDRKLQQSSLRGRAYTARRMEELGGGASGSHERLLTEQACFDRGKRAEGYDRIVNGGAEGKLMPCEGCLQYGLAKNDVGERVLPMKERAQLHRIDSTRKSASCTALAMEDQLDCYPANDAPAAALPTTTGTSCFPLSTVLRATERRSRLFRCCTSCWWCTVREIVGGTDCDRLGELAAGAHVGMHRHASLSCCDDHGIRIRTAPRDILASRGRVQTTFRYGCREMGI